MRQSPTDAEGKAWQLIRATRMEEWRSQWVPEELWRKDQTICPFYILDFYCPELKLAVEIDGSIHDGNEVVDRYRDNNLRRMGITTYRFPNDTILNDPTHFTTQLAKIVETKRKQRCREHDK